MLYSSVSFTQEHVCSQVDSMDLLHGGILTPEAKQTEDLWAIRFILLCRFAVFAVQNCDYFLPIVWKEFCTKQNPDHFWMLL